MLSFDECFPTDLIVLAGARSHWAYLTDLVALAGAFSRWTYPTGLVAFAGVFSYWAYPAGLVALTRSFSDWTCATGLVALAGALSHWLYFIHGEHHRQATLYFGLSVSIPLAIILFETCVSAVPVSTRQAFMNAFMLELIFLTSLFLSILIYRLYVHPLRHFPGPKTMALSKWGHVFRSRKLDNHHQMDRLRREYGDFVRTGPNELTIFKPEAYTALHGSQSKCTKAAWYDVLKPNDSMHSTRMKSAHGLQKKAWDLAFSAKAVSEYEDCVVEYTEMLHRKLSEKEGQILNMTDFVFYFVADVVGDVVSGTKFDMLRSGKRHFAADLLSSGFKPVGYLNPMPWLLVFLMALPGILGPWYRVVEWSKREIKRRLEMKPEKCDILSWLIDAHQKGGATDKNHSTLADEAVLAVLAGSGTITPVLTFLVYELALSPCDVRKIREELQTVENIRCDHQLKRLPHLNAVIHETMRVHPPVLDGLPRDTPAEGVTIDGRRIPGNVTCIAPFSAICKLETSFEEPELFIPERWTTAPQLVMNRQAHMPFSLGPYGCVGKNLALMILRIVTASLADNFDMEFAPGETKSRIVEESYNTVTNNPGSLRLILRKRKGSDE